MILAASTELETSPRRVAACAATTVVASSTLTIASNGRSSAICTIFVAERAGRPRSSPICEPFVRRESGPRSSDPTTTSTPSRRAAVMNAFARYVFAAISSRMRRGAS